MTVTDRPSSSNAATFSPIDSHHFLLFRVFPTLQQWKQWGLDLDEDTSLHVHEAAQSFARDILWPLNSQGDQESCHIDKGDVITPRGFPKAYREFCAAGWNAVDIDSSMGGQNLPHTLTCMVNAIFSAHNMAFAMYPGLTHGAFSLLNTFGSPSLKQHLLPQMVTGEYSGTMCLTESQCGSDLSLIKTQAHRTEGSLFDLPAYRVHGSKIFISCGDHDLTSNIVHLVLAKTDLQAPGTKGISLFLVPKFKLDHQGRTLPQRNGVTCIGLEHKMGIKASATAQLVFEDCEGYLIGEENKGLQYMFAMMNEARLLVGVQGLGLSTKAFELSQSYAQERLAGKSLYADHSHETHSLIIHHPDVRKMLMRQFVHIVSGQYLVLWMAQQLDIMAHSTDAAEREKAQDLCALLTPLVKSMLTDQSVANTNDALQVFGGHGYLKDYHVEQLYRDARITPIYEGTNTIQALDLLGRKVLGRQGHALIHLMQSIDQFTQSTAWNQPAYHTYAQRLSSVIHQLQTIGMTLMTQASRQPVLIAAAASSFLQTLGHLLYAYAWLHIVSTPGCSPALDQGCHFYFTQCFPQTLALLEQLQAPLSGIESAPGSENFLTAS